MLIFFTIWLCYACSNTFSMPGICWKYVEFLWDLRSLFQAVYIYWWKFLWYALHNHIWEFFLLERIQLPLALLVSQMKDRYRKRITEGLVYAWFLVAEGAAKKVTWRRVYQLVFWLDALSVLHSYIFKWVSFKYVRDYWYFLQEIKMRSF